MSINELGMIFQFVGGLGMFLYGMNAMADGLQRFAGNRLQKFLGICAIQNPLYRKVWKKARNFRKMQAASLSDAALGTTGAGVYWPRDSV